MRRLRFVLAFCPIALFASPARADETHAQWDLGGLVGVAKPDTGASLEPALSFESAYRRELSPWFSLSVGPRFTFSPSASFGALSVPVRLVMGKAWPIDGGGHVRSGTLVSYGVAPMLAAHHGGQAGGCLLTALAQRLPRRRSSHEVFVEGDICGTLPDHEQTFVWLGWRSGTRLR